MYREFNKHSLLQNLISISIIAKKCFTIQILGISDVLVFIRSNKIYQKCHFQKNLCSYVSFWSHPVFTVYNVYYKMFSRVDKRVFRFHRIFQEVITATGNRVKTCSSDVKFFYGFRTRCCIHLRLPGLAELAVNNSRRRVSCRNSCFSTAFSATAIFAGWDGSRSSAMCRRPHTNA